MNESRWSSVLWMLRLLPLTLAAAPVMGGDPNVPSPARVKPPQLLSAYGKLPLSFEANRGQTDPRVRFLSRGSGYGVFLAPTEAVLVLGHPADGKPDVLRLSLAGANPEPEVTGIEEQPGKSHYFVGKNSAAWHTDIPQYARVQYRGVYPGIDLTYYGNQRQLEYDLVVAPGADPGTIRMRIQGAREMWVAPDGSLMLRAGGGLLAEPPPIVYQIGDDGLRRSVEGRYVLKGRREVGFKVGVYDRRRSLIIDPILNYSTYLGGAGYDRGAAIAVDAAGNAYVTGDTWSASFPTSGAFQPSLGGSADAFVLKLDPAGRIVYSSFLGGSGQDEPSGIALDGSGNVYVTGWSRSDDFPTANAFQAQKNPYFSDAFVTKLAPSGSALVYSTFLGGDLDDMGDDIAVDAQGSVYLVGTTNSTDLATPFAFQPTLGGALDAFVARLDPAGTTLLFATYLGGESDDVGEAIALAGQNPCVTGYTSSTNFPLQYALQAAYGGDVRDGFVTMLAENGQQASFSTYLGGDRDDWPHDIAVDGPGNIYLTGHTSSANFPTFDALQSAKAGGDDGGLDAFVTKMDASGSIFHFSTFLGGSSTDQGLGLALGPLGEIFVVGETFSQDFWLYQPIQSNLAAPYKADVFFTQLKPSGVDLEISTYLGGSLNDYGVSVATDGSGAAYITGYTQSTDFPAANSVQATYGGGVYDAFVARIGANRPPVARAGADQVVDEGVVVTLDGSASSDPDGQPISFVWFDEDTGTLLGDTAVVTVTPSPGTHTYSLRVSDGEHLATDLVTVVVQESKPLRLDVNSVENGNGLVQVSVAGRPDEFCYATPGTVQSCFYLHQPGTVVTLNASAGPDSVFLSWLGACAGPTPTCQVTVTDDLVVGADFRIANHPPTPSAGGPYSGVRNQAITFDGTGSSDPDGDALTYNWDFGDGSTGTGPSPTHAYTTLGSFPVTLTVGDGNGGTATASTVATISNRAPVASAGPDQGMELGSPVTLNGSSSSDPDGDALSYEWRDGAGNLVGSSATVTLTLPLGPHDFTLTVRDGFGGGASDVVRVTVNDTTAPSVTVTAPEAVTILTGVPYSIAWTASDLGTIGSFDVLFSGDGGAVFAPVPGCTGVSGAARSCTWSSPGPATAQGRIRVVGRDASGNAGSDDSSFTMVDPVVTVTSPNTAVNWGVGSTQTIAWSHNLGSGSTVRIEISRDGGATWNVIAASATNTSATSGSFNWNVTGPNATAARVRVTFTANPAGTDTSDVNFTIASAFVTVTSPNTSVRWYVGTTRTITWNHNLGTSAFVKLEVSRDGGSTWSLINASVQNSAAGTGSYDWTVTGPSTNKARIRATWTANTAVNDRSDVNFSIR